MWRFHSTFHATRDFLDFDPKPSCHPCRGQLSWDFWCVTLINTCCFIAHFPSMLAPHHVQTLVCRMFESSTQSFGHSWRKLSQFRWSSPPPNYPVVQVCVLFVWDHARDSTHFVYRHPTKYKFWYPAVWNQPRQTVHILAPVYFIILAPVCFII